MSLKDKIEEDFKNAFKNKEQEKLDVLRMLKSSIQNWEIDNKKEPDDKDVVSLINKEVKKRKESIVTYKSGGRPELAEKEKSELAILKVYLPEEMPEEEITKIVKEAISEVDAKGMDDIGKVMAKVMSELSGKADGQIVNNIVRSELSKNDS